MSIYSQVVNESNGVGLLLTFLLSSSVLSAIITGVFISVNNRRDNRVRTRDADRGDRALELQQKDSDLKNALALAAETRETMSGLLEQLRAQSASQATTITGLNKTIETLNETIRRLESLGVADREAIESQRLLVAERTAERDRLEAEHEKALKLIADQEKRLSEKDAEIIALAGVARQQ